MKFGENLISLRKKNNMTQEAVAEKLEITRQTVSNWELNQTKPDLDQLKELSKLYNISIDELVDNNIQKVITQKASNSEKSKLFYKIVNFISMNKKVVLMIFTLICVIAIGVCLIVDYAINATITWGYISVLSIIFAYLIIIPIFIKKNKILLFLCVLTITILPFLYFMEKAMSVKEWFYPLALSISTIAICATWISYLICRFLKISKWYKIAILIFLWGTIISPIINYVVDKLPYISLQNLTSVFSCLIVSFVCIIYGYIKQQKKEKKL